MDTDDMQHMHLLLEKLNTCSQEEASRIILDLDILTDRKPNVFLEHFTQRDLGHLLHLLNRLTGKTKSSGVRLANKVFHLLGPTNVVAKNIDAISEILLSNDEELKLFCLNQLALAAVTMDGMNFMIKDMQETEHQILKVVLKGIEDEQISVAKSSATVIQNIMLFSEGLEYLLSDTFMKLFNDLLGNGSVVRFRVYQLFIDLVISNNGVLDNKKVQKVVLQLVQELESDDILANLNCLEMLGSIASSSSNGLDFIKRSGALQKLYQIFQKAELGPLMQILLPGVIKFFGSIALTMPNEILLAYPDFVLFTFDGVNGDDITLKTLCFETIANICSLEEGLRIFYQNPERMNQVMHCIGRVLLSSVEEHLKVRILDALALLFAISETNCSRESSSIKEALYQQIGQKPIESLMACAKLPFLKIRCSALGALASLATHSWSEQDMALTAGFLEYLLDRRTEKEKEGKELKYQILKTLSQSMTSKENIGIEYYERVCNYVLEGPFYSEQQTAVDFEKL